MLIQQSSLMKTTAPVYAIILRQKSMKPSMSTRNKLATVSMYTSSYEHIPYVYSSLHKPQLIHTHIYIYPLHYNAYLCDLYIILPNKTLTNFKHHRLMLYQYSNCSTYPLVPVMVPFCKDMTCQACLPHLQHLHFFISLAE